MRSRILSRILLVAGMAFFWPLVRGPFFVVFFGPAAGVPDSVPYVFNVLALLLSVALGAVGARALEAPAVSRRSRVVPVFLAVAVAASVALAVQTLADETAGGLTEGSAWGTGARVASAPFAAAAFGSLACAWAAACRARVRASSYIGLSFDVMLSYLASFVVGFPYMLADALPARLCLALFPAASALLWWAFAAGVGAAGERVSRSRTRLRSDSQPGTQPHPQPEPQPQPQPQPQLRLQPQPQFQAHPQPNAPHLTFLLLAAVAVLELASAVLSGTFSRSPVGGEALSFAFALPLVPCVYFAARRPNMRAVIWGIALIPVAMGAMLVMAYRSPFIEAGLDALTMGRRTVWVLYFLVLVNAGVSCEARCGGGAGASAVRLMGRCFVPLYALTRLVLDSLRLADVGEVLSEDSLRVLTVAVALVLTACSFAIVGLAVAGRYAAEGPGSRAGSPGSGAVPGLSGAVSGAAPGSVAGLAPGVSESSGALDRELRHLACAALAGEFGLTDRETAVLELVSMGYTVQRIAEERGVTPNTVRTHTKGLYRKLDTHSKQEVIELVNRRMGCGDSTDVEADGGKTGGGEPGRAR